MSLNTLTVKLARMPEIGMTVAYETIDLAIAEKGYSPKPGDGESDLSETIEIYLTGANAVAVQDKLRALNRMLNRARERKQREVGDRIFLMIHVDGELNAELTDAWFGSEVLNGQVSIAEGEIEGPLANGRVLARLAITRRGFFEDSVLRYLPLTNANGTRIQTINVFNCMDLVGTSPNKRDNHVEIAASDIAGDLPAPVRLTTTLIGTNGVKRIFISKFLNHNGSESTLDLASHYRDISGTADANASGGAYKSQAISTDNETAIISGIDLTGIFLRMGGDVHHIMAKFRDSSSLGNVQFYVILSAGGVRIWESAPIRLKNSDLVQELAAVNMPPAGGRGLNVSLSMDLTAKRLTANTETINLDFFQFFGREFTRIEFVGASTASTSAIYYGGPNYDRHKLYSGNFMTDVIPYGAESLTVTPGKVNGFFFLAESQTPNIGYQLTVQAQYRARRSTL